MKNDTCIQFNNLTKEEQELVISYMDIIIQEMISNRNHVPIPHIAKVIQEFYDSFPGLYEYRMEKLYEVAPDGNVFSTYMPDPGPEARYVNKYFDGTTYAKAINIEEKSNEDN